MCSSPKNSGGSPPKVRLKGFYEDMGKDRRKKFTETANRADERRTQRQKANKRWEAKHMVTKKSEPNHFFSWFGKQLGLI